MIISGAFGNFIDRLNYGAVIDFIDFHINNYHWYAFNVADSAICIGAFVMLFENFKNDNKYKKI
jgi:signal peptidase II